MKNRVIDKEVDVAWMIFNNSRAWESGGSNKTIDKVWILTFTEIGGKTVSPTKIDNFTDYAGSCISTLNSSGNDGEEYDYFLDDVNKRKSTGNSGKIVGTYGYIWLATGFWNGRSNNATAIAVLNNGSFGGLSTIGGNSPQGYIYAVPAVRVA